MINKFDILSEYKVRPGMLTPNYVGVGVGLGVSVGVCM